MSVQGLRSVMQRYQAAPPALRDPLRASTEAMATTLAKARTEVVARMEKRWGWLDANEGHPQFEEREDALIADIAEYEAMENALRDAATALYGEVA